MNDKSISIIIPSYKPGPWFEECIASVSKQTYDKSLFEVIVVLNGDLSFYGYVYDIINNFLSNINHSLIKISKGSVSNARNVGLDNSKGNYIIFVDDDDLISPDFLKSIIKVSNVKTVGVGHIKYFNKTICDSYVSDDIKHKELNLLRYKSFFRNRKCFGGPVGKCINKELIGSDRFDVNFQLCEDNLFWLTIVYKIKYLRLVDNSACYYVRIRPNSLSRSKYDSWYLVKTAIQRNHKIIRLYLRHPFRNNSLLFLSKLRTSTLNSVRLIIHNYFDCDAPTISL